jgi:hypothetical protein
MADSKSSKEPANTQQSKPEENVPGGATEAQAKQARDQGTATGVEGVRGEEGGLQTQATPGGELPLKELDETNRTDSDRLVNPNPNVGAVLNPPINPTKDEDRDKPVYIPPPGVENRELRKNVEKHTQSLLGVFDTADSDRNSKDKK